ncbi:uncharacterized protein LOC110348496 [Heterocephalus glaber]|uniref:Uncharacterized protein LOC110348496 n=1 Tax=Heterocephalus glaber TaxID=10181 RepID=A0AAX6SNZ4_HETGA|nr:uncharacterized protein LOC110348496 [Heterocephalus glaber]
MCGSPARLPPARTGCPRRTRGSPCQAALQAPSLHTRDLRCHGTLRRLPHCPPQSDTPCSGRRQPKGGTEPRELCSTPPPRRWGTFCREKPGTDPLRRRRHACPKSPAGARLPEPGRECASADGAPAEGLMRRGRRALGVAEAPQRKAGLRAGETEWVPAPGQQLSGATLESTACGWAGCVLGLPTPAPPVGAGPLRPHCGPGPRGSAPWWGRGEVHLSSG